MTVTSVFEEYSLEEYRRKYLGVRLDEFSFDWREFLRSLILAVPGVFLFMPFYQTIIEYWRCERSIRQIEEAELRALEKTKKSYMARTLLNNPNFNT